MDANVRNTINEYFKSKPIQKAWVFGSVARGEEHPDSDVDIQTAKNAGVPCISVLWGFRNREFLLEHGAQRFIERPLEIIGV